MRLLYVHDHIYSVFADRVYSGQFTETFFRRYLDFFDEITIVARSNTVDREPVGLSLASGENVRFKFAESISSARSFVSLRRRQFDRVSALIRENDLLLVRLPSEHGLLAAKAARRLGHAYAVEVVGCALDSMLSYGGIVPKLYAFLLYLRMRACVSRSRYVSYVTNTFLQRRYPANRDAVTTAISNVSLDISDDSVLARRLSHILVTRSSIRIGTIGSLKTRYKGIDTGIGAIAILRRLGFDVEYRVLGSGNVARYEALAERLGVSDWVKFDGTREPGEAVSNWLDSIDLYVQPSLTEGLPRALLEAMSRGCPAVGTSVGGIPELLEPEELVGKRDPRALARAIEELLGSRERMSEAARRNFEVAKRYRFAALQGRRREFLRHAIGRRCYKGKCRGVDS